MNRRKHWILAAAMALFSALSLAETGVTETSIVLGMSAPLSGQSSVYGHHIKEAVAAYFDRVNKAGGIGGRKLELVALDDGYDTARTLANTKTLIGEKNVFALIGYYGTTPTTEAMNTVFGPSKVPLIGAISGAQELRNQASGNANARYLFNVRASYADETEVIVNHLIAIGLNRIAVLYQNDGFGKSGLDGITAALKKQKLAPVAVGTVERNSVEVASAVDAISKANPQAIVMVTLYKPTAAFVKAMRAARQSPLFMALSPVGADQLVQEMGPDARGIGVSQVMPNPWNEKEPVVREYQHTLGKQSPYSYHSIEGYLMARVLVDALKKMGKDITREKLIATLENLNQDFGGYRVKFSPASHAGSQFVELTVVGADGKILR